jgi:hypothetical protein
LFSQLLFGFVGVGKILFERGKQGSLMRHSNQAAPYGLTGTTLRLTARRTTSIEFRNRAARGAG